MNELPILFYNRRGSKGGSAMAQNPVRWFEIYVQDLDRAKRFYESVFKVKFEKIKTPDTLQNAEFEMWAFPSSKEAFGCSGALVRMKGVPSGGGTLVYFASDDCAEEEKRI